MKKIILALNFVLLTSSNVFAQVDCSHLGLIKLRAEYTANSQERARIIGEKIAERNANLSDYAADSGRKYATLTAKIDELVRLYLNFENSYFADENQCQ
jgi:hypothetical protein